MYALLTNLFNFTVLHCISCHFAKGYSTERVHQFTLIYAILG